MESLQSTFDGDMPLDAAYGRWASFDD